jgi:hypothetical protein
MVIHVFDAAAAVPESVSKPMETVPPAGSSLVQSGAEASHSHSISIAALILAGAAAAAVVT